MSDLYYVQDSRSYLGNDILWWADKGGYTTNLSKAEVFTKERAVHLNQNRITDIPWPKEYIDERTRPAVDVQYTNIKEALKGKGIRLKKKKWKRPTMGKTRGNCPECGKITWDYNPYENARCSDHQKSYDIEWLNA
ncbi:MAG: hypothetical protein JKY81_04725 [Colwellia sp.]|nr:hypothetical protein [Colwellia sp.]